MLKYSSRITKSLISLSSYRYSAKNKITIRPRIPTPVHKIVEVLITQHQKQDFDVTNIKNFLKFNKWNIKTKEAARELTKVAGNNNHVHVIFYPRGLPDLSEEQIANHNPNDTNLDPLQQFGFCVYIHKPNQNRAMCIDFEVRDADPQIEHIFFVEDYTKHQLIRKQKRSAIQYQGPELGLLDDQLLSGLSQFLSMHGVNSELVEFIGQYSVYAQHQQFKQWLLSINNLVSQD